MSPSTRRAVLRGAAGTLAAGLAGCRSTFDGSGTSETPAPASGELVTGYEHQHVRRSGEATLWRNPDESDHPHAVTYLTSADDAAALEFADLPEARTMGSFVRATDFESESVLFRERRIGACEAVRLGAVRRSPDRVSVTFCRTTRPADVDCSTDDRATVGDAVRLPFAGDPDDGFDVPVTGRCPGRYGPTEAPPDGTRNASGGGSRA